MRDRGLEWMASDAQPPSGAAVARSGALAAVQAAEVDMIFFAWWSKPKPNNKRKLGAADEHAGAEIGDSAVPEDRRLLEHCVARGVPCVFISEPEGGATRRVHPSARITKRAQTHQPRARRVAGITGSPELWRGPYAVRPATELLDGFVDVPRWQGFSDSTWVVTPGGAAPATAPSPPTGVV